MKIKMFFMIAVFLGIAFSPLFLAKNIMAQVEAYDNLMIAHNVLETNG